MSPRAACRLESLGFTTAYDYVAGKVDWMAAGLPTVRSDTSERRALDVLDPTPPTCSLDEPVADVAARGAAGAAFVVIDDGIVAGRLVLGESAGDRLVSEAMQPGPTTVRANEPLDALLERMRKHNVHEMIVTTPEGRLLGVVRA